MSNERLTVSRNQREGRYAGHMGRVSARYLGAASGHVRSLVLTRKRNPPPSTTLAYVMRLERALDAVRQPGDRPGDPVWRYIAKHRVDQRTVLRDC